MDWRENYQSWLENETLEDHLKQELLSINDEAKLKERFCQHLEFGTGGMRGKLGAGTNRMNRYSIRRATSGLAEYLLAFDENAAAKGVVISYDSRHFSKDFAHEAARVLADRGILVYLSDDLRPTPLLSFMVRRFHAAAGIMITASHNPSNYNGYKVYGPDGGQMTPKTVDILSGFIDQAEDNASKEVQKKNQQSIKKETIRFFGAEADKLYLNQVSSVIQHPETIRRIKPNFRIVYTPLHGSGLKLVTQALTSNGFSSVTVVLEQKEPDGDFPTVASPNPEEDAAFDLAIDVGTKEKAAVLMATDPDADRLGIAVLNQQGIYTLLNGNQLGVLLLHYLLKTKNKQKLEGKTIIKSIVTSDLGSKIAEKYGVTTVNTLTGFKYIGEKIGEFEKAGEDRFLFGFEESFGYLIQPFVRDKDAIQTALLTAEAAAAYDLQGKTLLDGLKEIHEEFGYYLEDLETIVFEGAEAQTGMRSILKEWRTKPPKAVSGEKISQIEDFLLGQSKDLKQQRMRKIELDRSNVLKFSLEDGSWFCIRPSGTEQKCKLYFSVHADSERTAQKKLSNLKSGVLNLFARFSKEIQIN